MTYPRDLIRRLVDALHGYKVAHPEHDDSLVTEARAYLATPEPAAVPTDEELLRCMIQGAESVPDGQCTGIIDWETEAIAAARAVLARWGHRPEPIALSDRLPGPEDCDAEGRCWVFDQGHAVTAPAWNYESSADLQDLRRMQDEGQLIGLCERWRLAWLPHHALPLPGGEV